MIDHAGAAPRVVVVGSGSAGRRHVTSIRRCLPDAEITVVRRAASRQPVEALETAQVAFVTSVTDAVDTAVSIGVVAGPAPFHREAAIALGAAGAVLLVEKPLALTASEALDMVDRAAATGVPLIVGYHLRYGDTVPRLRQCVPELGELTGFAFTVGQHLDQWRPDVDPRQSVTARHELGGGVLLELSHELDGVRYVLGEVASVRARTRIDGAPTDGIVDTVADLDLRLESGVTGTVHLDMVAADAHRTWTVTGIRGSATADLIAGTVVRHGPDGNVLSVTRCDPGERERAEARLIGNVVDVWRGDGQPVCTGADGVAAMKIVDAARTSAAAGGTAVELAGPDTARLQEDPS